MFPTDLVRRAFRASNGELGWSRDDARLAVAVLVKEQRAILGGELWWIPEGRNDWTGLIPQRQGPDAVYPWATERDAGEQWSAFVLRCADETLQAVERWPGINELRPDLGGRILYNLTWVSETQYRELVGESKNHRFLFRVESPGPRPPFALVAEHLWGSLVDFDSDGNSRSADDRGWTELTVIRRDRDEERVDIDPISDDPLVLRVASDSQELARKAAVYLAKATGGRLAS
jgi:hypothetical protein